MYVNVSRRVGHTPGAEKMRFGSLPVTGPRRGATTEPSASLLPPAPRGHSWLGSPDIASGLARRLHHHHHGGWARDGRGILYGNEWYEVMSPGAGPSCWERRRERPTAQRVTHIQALGMVVCVWGCFLKPSCHLPDTSFPHHRVLGLAEDLGKHPLSVIR